MKLLLRQTLDNIAYDCMTGTANRQSAYALEIISDALSDDVDLNQQCFVIDRVIERLALDDKAADGDGDLLLAAARRIALVTEQRSEDRYAWGE